MALRYVEAPPQSHTNYKAHRAPRRPRVHHAHEAPKNARESDQISTPAALLSSSSAACLGAPPPPPLCEEILCFFWKSSASFCFVLRVSVNFVIVSPICQEEEWRAACGFV